ncbi:MAG: hypothetical protein MMC23_009377 [Stictis urceolatum]|nr:hypothetical protein [Stictis urceolata]
MSLPGNVNRTEYRVKCRQKLSDHIFNQIGVSIDPTEVRLITRDSDPYAWKVFPEKQHLSKKHLSKHSVGAYRQLCREVGKSFEAVQPSRSIVRDGEQSADGHEDTGKMTPNVSFSAVIEDLQAETRALMLRLDESNKRIDDEKTS